MTENRKRTGICYERKAGYDVKKIRYEWMTNGGKKDMELSRQVANKLMKIVTPEIWNTVRGKPPRMRKAAVVISGAPGTGKTLLSNILCQGLRKGHVDTLNLQFPLGACYGVEVIQWEEANMPFQHFDIFKKVFEGRDYPINRKGKEQLVQSEWTPIVLTTNQRTFPTDAGHDDREALHQRSYYIKMSAGQKWWGSDITDDQMNELDLGFICDCVDVQWHKGK